MSRGIVTRENLEDIADAIRAKLDTDDTYTPAQMAAAIALIHGEPVLQSKTATQNGTVTPDSGYDGLDQVTVNVPNTYGASDEGKVVSNAALVAQTARTVTENGTFDTTLNSSVTVAVPRPAGTLAKKGASSTVSSIPALYGPMGTLSSDFLTPVGFATGANVTLNTAQPYEVKAVFKLTQLPATQAAIFGHADSTHPVPAMYVEAGGGNIKFAIPEPPEIQGGNVIYREGNVYSTDTPLPLNTEITVSIRCNGTSFVVTVDNGTAVTSKSDTDYTPYAGTGGLLLGMDERRENGLAGVSGAYINAEDSAIIQNGTRLWGGVIEGGGGGSEPVIQPLTVNENGTYTPPTGVDGYGPVTVNVSGGGGGDILTGSDAPAASLGIDGDVYKRVITIPSNVNFVEYLQSSGTEYINTGIYATQDIDAVVTADRGSGSSGSNAFNGCALGVRTGSWNGMTKVLYFGAHNDNAGAISVIKSGTSAPGSVSNTPGVSTRRTKTVTDINGYHVYIATIDQNGNYAKTYRQSGDWQSDMPLCIGAFYQGTTLSTGGKVKVHRVTVLDKGVPIADYLPCLDGNGVACMWDNIAGEYVYNDGTGDFTYGSTITPDALDPVYYVKKSGAWEVIGQ